MYTQEGGIELITSIVVLGYSSTTYLFYSFYLVSIVLLYLFTTLALYIPKS